MRIETGSSNSPKNIIDVRPYKAKLRQEYKELRREMSPADKKRLDDKIACRLFKTWQYCKQDTLLTYVSTAIEVDTFNIIQNAWRDGKRVAVPRCVDGQREMEFYFIRSLDDLEVRTFHVLEPIPERCEQLTNFSRGLCIVPALSFDYKGYRLGYGGGYYDRFLAKFTGYTVGLCYASCVRKTMIKSKYDRPVELLITDKYLRRTGNHR